ncbi:glycosyltransferase family 4 protein [Stackebrandtia soli]|uniref:glycosyltransferase family 4 protein n=1 Tax=Stackebrandtia soli TaxID=1892856 RepID=UPI0039ED04B8
MSGRRIAQVLGTTTGGIGTHVASVTRGFLERGDRVSVYGPRATDEQFGFSAAGARFVPVEISPTPHPLRDATAIASLRRVLHATAGVAPDVVHAHGMRAGLVSRLARPAASPLVVTWHTHLNPVGNKGKLLRAAEMAVARGADVCLCTDPGQVGHLVDSGGRDVRCIPVVAPPLAEPAVAVDQMKAQLGATDRPLILSISRLHPVKRLDVLIDAAARWASLDPAPKVVIAGDGPLRRELSEHIHRTGADVTLLGHRTDPADLLAAADIAVLTSDSEARPLFAQEALHAETPLVATRAGGTADLVGDGALLVDTGDVDGVDASVRRLLASPKLVTELVDAGRRQAKTWPSNKDSIDHLDALYQELTGR